MIDSSHVFADNVDGGYFVQPGDVFGVAGRLVVLVHILSRVPGGMESLKNSIDNCFQDEIERRQWRGIASLFLNVKVRIRIAAILGEALRMDVPA
jgi:hypothetical protein